MFLLGTILDIGADGQLKSQRKKRPSSGADFPSFAFQTDLNAHLRRDGGSITSK